MSMLAIRSEIVASDLAADRTNLAQASLVAARVAAALGRASRGGELKSTEPQQLLAVADSLERYGKVFAGEASYNSLVGRTGAADALAEVALAVLGEESETGAATRYKSMAREIRKVAGGSRVSSQTLEVLKDYFVTLAKTISSILTGSGEISRADSFRLA